MKIRLLILSLLVSVPAFALAAANWRHHLSDLSLIAK